MLPGVRGLWTAGCAESTSSQRTCFVFADKIAVDPNSYAVNTALNRRRRKRVEKSNNSPSAIHYMVCAASVFERWLWARSSENAEVMEIPPEELDPLLVEFYKGVRNRLGTEYSAGSFKRLRANLDKYLHETNYPCSIVTSSLFRSSQRAFQQKLDDLGC